MGALGLLFRRARKYVYAYDLSGGIPAVAAKVPVDVVEVSAGDLPVLERQVLAELDFLGRWSMRRYVRSGSCRVFAARADGKFMHLSVVQAGPRQPGGTPVKEREAFIGPCYTVSDARGLHIFPHVLGWLMQRLAEEGFCRVVTAVNVDNVKSIRSIERSGFVRVGEVRMVRILGHFKCCRRVEICQGQNESRCG